MAGGQPGADPVGSARDICLRQLAVRPRSRAELAAALERRGVDQSTVDAVLDRLVALGLIDDEAFAAAVVSSAVAGRGLSRRALVHELRRRGVDPEIASEAVAVVGADDEESTARELVRRRLSAMHGLAEHVRVRRLTALLARRGYPTDLALRVVADELARDERAERADRDQLPPP